MSWENKTNPTWLRQDVFNPIDVELLLAGHYPASAVRSAEKAAAIQHLFQKGCTAEEIAVQLRMSERHVERLRHVPVRAPDRVQFDLSDARCAHLMEVARSAQRFVAGMRDDVETVWRDLVDMDKPQLRELLMVMAAMVPDGATPSQLLGWVTAITEEVA